MRSADTTMSSNNKMEEVIKRRRSTFLQQFENTFGSGSGKSHIEELKVDSSLTGVSLNYYGIKSDKF
ncbi:hypothetical protein [Exiguobacterium indicum]|uniref:hypothetical protein n=1 Tax=Exiguobacterium indicum TaxID=296995 RepID=UPI002B2640C6|nr:hypothetical protein [Exiguobacterium indicum]